MNNVLSVQALTKYYGRLCALNQVNFTVPSGSVFGILGPNGSGKTTLLGIVTDVLKPSGGHFTWGDENHRMDRRHIGTLLETPNFYPYLSAYDNLYLQAAIRECASSDIDRVLRVVQLYDRRHTPFKTFSLGMKQRLAIAAALLGDPEIILLDEPTNGLDPVGIADIRSLIMEMGQNGKTVLIASHLLDEVEKVCSHVAILKQGQLLASGPVAEVLNKGSFVVVSASDVSQLEKCLIGCPGVEKFQNENGHFQVVLANGYSVEQLNTYCFAHEVVLNRLEERKQSLELKFLELTSGPVK